MMGSLREIARHPVTTVGATLTAILGIANYGFVFAVGEAIFASAPQIFTLATVGALTFPEFWPPDSTADWIGVAATGLFVAYLGFKINENFDAEGL